MLYCRSYKEDPYEHFTRCWAEYVTSKRPYPIKKSRGGPYHQFIQSHAEYPARYHFKASLCTSDRDEFEDLTEYYSDRWHIEEFFKNDQEPGWKVAGTRNLHIRFAKMTLVLVDQEETIASFRSRTSASHSSQVGLSPLVRTMSGTKLPLRILFCTNSAASRCRGLRSARSGVGK